MRRSFFVPKAIVVLLLPAGAALGVLTGCSSTTEVDDADSGTDCPALSSACSATPPSWQSAVRPIVLTYCTECHGAGGVAHSMFDSTMYQSVFVARSELATVMVNCSMPPLDAAPPAPAPDGEQRQTVLSWVACGAPDN